MGAISRASCKPLVMHAMMTRSARLSSHDEAMDTGTARCLHVVRIEHRLFGHWRGLTAATHLAATGLIASVLYSKLKRWTKRPRPFAADLRIKPWIAPLDEFSFPSGHTLHAVSFTLVALAYYPLLAWLLVPFSLSVAVSRVVLGMHYPSDVFAAALIGGALASLSLWLVPGASFFL